MDHGDGVPGLDAQRRGPDPELRADLRRTALRQLRRRGEERSWLRLQSLLAQMHGDHNEVIGTVVSALLLAKFLRLLRHLLESQKQQECLPAGMRMCSYQQYKLVQPRLPLEWTQPPRVSL
jgi:hypothetical protein